LLPRGSAKRGEAIRKHSQRLTLRRWLIDESLNGVETA
jgi:hypothetical protein